MTNEEYLIVSYSISGAVTIALGLLVYFYLRRSFCIFVDTVSGRHFPAILKKLFPFGLVVPDVMGFLSVSYASCDRATYDKIVPGREYLVEKNQQQLSSVLLSRVITTLFWDLILIFVQKYSRGASKRS